LKSEWLKLTGESLKRKPILKLAEHKHNLKVSLTNSGKVKSQAIHSAQNKENVKGYQNYLATILNDKKIA